jgi:hypothetical protein
MRHKAVTTTALVGTWLVAAWAACPVAIADTGTDTPRGVAAPIRGGISVADNLPNNDASADAVRAAEAYSSFASGEASGVRVVAPPSDSPVATGLEPTRSEMQPESSVVVPEPGSALLFLTGAVIALRMRRRRLS